MTRLVACPEAQRLNTFEHKPLPSLHILEALETTVYAFPEQQIDRGSLIPTFDSRQRRHRGTSRWNTAMGTSVHCYQ